LKVSVFSFSICFFLFHLFIILFADCPDPNFNALNTVVSKSKAAYGYILDQMLTVSCVTGYAFAAMEFRNMSMPSMFSPLSEVMMTCMSGGKWNVNTLPRCEREWNVYVPKSIHFQVFISCLKIILCYYLMTIKIMMRFLYLMIGKF
jgi:hypothetical protein